MNLCCEIRNAYVGHSSLARPRAQFHLRCGVFEEPTALLRSAVIQAGLRSEEHALRSIREDEALRSIVGFLHRSLAYGAECMPISQAEALAAAFLRQFSDATFYTNAWWSERSDGSGLALSRYHPMTDKTFDTGVVVMDSARWGFLWVEDED